MKGQGGWRVGGGVEILGRWGGVEGRCKNCIMHGRNP